MYFTDDSLLPENQAPLMITAAPYGPMWMPEDITPEQKLPVTWDEQVQAAVDCYNAGATLLHIHVRDPETGHISKDFNQYNDQIGRLRKAVPKMIRFPLRRIPAKRRNSRATTPATSWPKSIPGSSHSNLRNEPIRSDGAPSRQALRGPASPTRRCSTRWRTLWLTRHRTSISKTSSAWFGNGIQPYFALAHVHGLELVERLIRKGYYMGPMNGFFSIGGGGMCGANPFDLMELIRRTPHGSFFTYQTTFRLSHPVAAICIALGQHTRAGIEDNLWNTTKGVRMSTIEMIERHVRMANELGRPIATAEQARQMLKIGVTYTSTEETLANLGLPPNRRPGNMGFMVHETDGSVPSSRAGRVRTHPRRRMGGEAGCADQGGYRGRLT